MIDPSSIGAVTFDCYGTLVDWESGILRAVGSIAGRPIGADERAAVLGAYAELEHAAQAGAYRRYRDVLREVTGALGARFARDAGGANIADSIADWPAFDETPGALARLKTRFRLGVLSNIDDDLFPASGARLGVELDALVTAESVRSYKPAPAHFERAIEALSLPAARILHVAESRYHDVAPARALGFPTVWVNRAKGGASASGASDARPDLEVSSLAELCERLGV